MNNILQAALKLLDQGFGVIPVDEYKKPLIKWTELQNRLPSNEEVINWFNQFPNDNVGIITGLVSHLLVVDIDPRNNGTDEKFKEIHTVIAGTPRNGKHYYFRISEHFKTRGEIYPGIDIKADGGFVMAPPSFTEVGDYVWYRSPFEVPLAQLPQFLAEDLIKTTNTPVSPEFNPAILNGVGEGQRNSTATMVIGHLLALTHPEEWDEKCWPEILLWNAKNTPPLNESELKKTYDSIKFKELPKKLTRYNSFPPVEGLTPEVAERNQPIYSWDEFVNLKTEESGTWLVKHLIKPGWLAVLGGHGKQGKTTLVMHLLNALRIGNPFIFETTACPVIFLNCEMHEDDLKLLIKDVAGSSPIGETALIQSPIKPLDIKRLQTLLVNQPKPGLCVIDSFRGAFLLKNDYENQAGTVGVILRDLQNIARVTKWTILIIHHFNKEGSGDPRDLSGSSEWLSAPDAIITWVCNQFGHPGTLSITGRIPPIEDQLIKLERETIQFLGSTEDSSKLSKTKLILDIIKEEGGTTSEIIAQKTHLKEPTIRRILTTLAEQGQVKRYGKGVKNDPVMYLLPDNGLEYDSNES